MISEVLPAFTRETSSTPFCSFLGTEGRLQSPPCFAVNKKELGYSNYTCILTVEKDMETLKFFQINDQMIMFS